MKSDIKQDTIVTDQERLGHPFNYSVMYDAPLYESDMEYVDKVIKTDKIYRMIVQAYKSWDDVFSTNDTDLIGKEINGMKFISHRDDYYKQFIEDCNMIYFLSKFLDDRNCPKRVRYFLYVYIGIQYDLMATSKDICMERPFLTEKWFETCR